MFTLSLGIRYSGQWKEGHRHGRGKMVWRGSGGKVLSKYEGSWREGQVRDPPQHRLPSKTMARITSECGATRFLSIKWPQSPRILCPSAARLRPDGLPRWVGLQRQAPTRSPAALTSTYHPIKPQPLQPQPRSRSGQCCGMEGYGKTFPPGGGAQASGHTTGSRTSRRPSPPARTTGASE